MSMRNDVMHDYVAYLWKYRSMEANKENSKNTNIHIIRLYLQIDDRVLQLVMMYRFNVVIQIGEASSSWKQH